MLSSREDKVSFAVWYFQVETFFAIAQKTDTNDFPILI